MDELLLDYEDFLRQGRHPQWAKDDPAAQAVRAIGQVRTKAPAHPLESPDAPATDYAAWLDHADPAVVANALICLIHQANYLLDRQVRALESAFIQGGGYSEQLAAARLAFRRKDRAFAQSDQSDPTDPANPPPAPSCRVCGQPMVLRTARQGPRAGSQFWGCSGYPNCKSTQPL